MRDALWPSMASLAGLCVRLQQAESTLGLGQGAGGSGYMFMDSGALFEWPVP